MSKASFSVQFTQGQPSIHTPKCMHNTTAADAQCLLNLENNALAFHSSYLWGKSDTCVAFFLFNPLSHAHVSITLLLLVLLLLLCIVPHSQLNICHSLTFLHASTGLVDLGVALILFLLSFSYICPLPATVYICMYVSSLAYHIVGSRQCHGVKLACISLYILYN